MMSAGSALAAPPVGEVEIDCPDEARAVLASRTSRIAAITPMGRKFRLRYRSLALPGIHISRTWEQEARFAVRGEVLPIVFFPLEGATAVASERRETVMSARERGSFTVVRDATFQPLARYSELVLVFEPALLRHSLLQLGVEQPLDDLLVAAALRPGLPGLERLRDLALEVFASAGAGSERFRSLHQRIQVESLSLHAAAVLSHAASPGESAPGLSHPASARAVDFIMARLGEEILVEDIARASGASIRQLQLLFARDFGCSPREFLLQRRLEHARGLLLSRRAASVTDAALSSGFNHLGKFAGAYARTFGEPPSRTLRRRP